MGIWGLGVIQAFLVFCALLPGSAQGYEATDGIINAWDGTPLTISVVSEKTAQEIFQRLAKEDLVFRYPDNGCHARAMRMALIMEQEGIISAKVFVYGDKTTMKVLTKNHPQGYVNWGWHVAPILFVSKQNLKIPFVIDPSLFNVAVPFEKWFSVLSQVTPPEKLNIRIAKRTTFHPDDLGLTYNYYPRIDFTYSNIILSEAKKKLEERESRSPESDL